MFKNIYKILLILTLMLPAFSYAEDDLNIKINDEPNYFLMLLGFEALFAVNSWMASENPQAYGGLAALLFPLAGSQGNTSETTQWVTLAAAETLAIYNIKIDENEKSKSDIFKSNMIAWHIFAGTVGLTGYIMGDFESEKSVALHPLSTGGAQLSFTYKF